MAVLSAMRAHKHRLLSLLVVCVQARVRGVCGVRAACAQHAASARERRHAGGAAEGEKTSGRASASTCRTRAATAGTFSNACTGLFSSAIYKFWWVIL